MATRQRKRPKPTYGRRLEARRLALHRKSLDDIVKETDGRIYKQLWYRVENGLKKPKSLTPDQLSDFALVLEWTPQQLAEALEISAPLAIDVKNSTSGPVINLSTVRSVTLRIVGHSELGASLDVLESSLRGHAEETCVAVLTAGSVLACERVRNEYRDAESFIFTSERTPHEGNMILYRMRDTGAYLVCLYVETPADFPVRSYDGETKFYIRGDDPRLEFCGVQIGGTLKERGGDDVSN